MGPPSRHDLGTTLSSELHADEVFQLKEGVAHLLDEAQPDVQALCDRLAEIRNAMERG